MQVADLERFATAGVFAFVLFGLRCTPGALTVAAVHRGNGVRRRCCAADLTFVLACGAATLGYQLVNVTRAPLHALVMVGLVGFGAAVALVAMRYAAVLRESLSAFAVMAAAWVGRMGRGNRP